MSSPPKKEVGDPWRIDEPLRPTQEKIDSLVKKKIDLRDINLDADLSVPETYRFVSAHGSIVIKGHDLKTGNDALRCLVACLTYLVNTEKTAALNLQAVKIGFECGKVHFNVPRDLRLAARLETTEKYTPSAHLYFVQQTYDHGMLRLIRVLASAGRSSSSGATTLRRFGVMPLLKGN